MVKLCPAYLLLYCCTNNIIVNFMGCWCMFFFFCVLCCTTTAVVQGGWVDRFVGVSTGSWVSFFSFFFSPAIPAPRWHSSAYHEYSLIQQSRNDHVQMRTYSLPTRTVSVYPSLTTSPPPPAPPRPHARPTNAIDVVGKRTGRISAKLGDRGASKGALPGSVWLASPDLVPFFLYELHWLLRLFV